MSGAVTDRINQMGGGLHIEMSFNPLMSGAVTDRHLSRPCYRADSKFQSPDERGGH